MLYQDQALAVRESIVQAHQIGINSFGLPGAWFDGAGRLAILKEARAASTCTLCQQRKEALSPYSLDGNHDTDSHLPAHFPAHIVDVIHRLKTDSGRLTRTWFDAIITDELSPEAYVEIVGAVATSLILDSFATAIDSELLEPSEIQKGEPSKTTNDNVFDGGAWVPLFDLPQEMTATGLPSSPNIFRAMGLVPSAIEHFFGVMRSHYALADLDFAISRSQTELIASRVSSLNECFY